MGKIILIFGPTASSKSKIAIEIAQRYNGEIINSDSRQFFKYMEIGTASPTREDLKDATHHLYNILEPDQPINAGLFIKMADERIKDIFSRGKIPIVVGGTGLYLKTLIKGIAQIPDIPESIRSEIKEMITLKGISFCYDLLKEKDPDYAKIISPSDRQRIERALEVIIFTNEKFSTFHLNHQFRKDRYENISIGIMPERKAIYERINKRTADIFRNGIIEETEFLIKNGYIRTSAFNAIGYLEAYRYLKKEMTLNEAIETTALRTRHYAKRQITWFKKAEGKLFSDPDNIEKILEYFKLCLE